MKHLGDITKINEAEVPIVDCIIGGSPCQDLSIAGKRAGLDGERSGLFIEQIRIVREMRKRDAEENHHTGFEIRPRYMVWENVPGAFSSKGGKDFAAVIEEIAKTAEGQVPDLPDVKWTKSGCVYDEMGRWSIAWRVHDAQFWGVPQRRARIALVADFGGLSAPEILFERKGLSWRPDESGEEKEDSSSGTEGSFGISSDSLSGSLQDSRRAISFQERAGCDGGGKGILVQGDRTGALSTVQTQRVCVCIAVFFGMDCIAKSREPSGERRIFRGGFRELDYR